MVTFNELLSANGIDFTTVALVRHSGSGRLATPYELWTRNDGSFERYQSTQSATHAKLFASPIWASFVSDPAKETVFVGLYDSSKDDSSLINWDCPITGFPPGQDRGRQTSDLYKLSLRPELMNLRGSLKVAWGVGNIAWVRYASRCDCSIIGNIELDLVESIDVSPEGDKKWTCQLRVERDDRLVEAALAKNLCAETELYVCEACNFRHRDRAMFDVHHMKPLMAGPRRTKVSELLVLCPLCHRRAHQSGNRLLPYQLDDLRSWNLNGRP